MSLRFEIRKPKIQWVNVVGDLVGAATGGGTSSNYSSKAKVMAINDAGRRRAVGAADSEQSAEDRMVAIQADYESLSISMWCQKYDVPDSFAQE